MRASVVQVTNLGLTVKDSPREHAGPRHPARRRRSRWRAPRSPSAPSTTPSSGAGTTDEDGVVDRAAHGPARPGARAGSSASWSPRRRTATSPTSAATGTRGSSPGSSGIGLDLREAQPLLRGSVFADRGVYRLGEEVHFKADPAQRHRRTGSRLLTAGTAGRDRGQGQPGRGAWTSGRSRSRTGAARTGRITLPDDAPLGRYEVTATVAGQQRPGARASFLVAAYRRPDFRVDVNLAGESSLAGVGLKGVVTGRYLFGGPMAGRDVRWTYSRAAALRPCRARSPTRFPLGALRVPRRGARGPRDQARRETLLAREGRLDAQGQIDARPRRPTSTPAGPTSTRSKARSPTSRARRSPGRASFRVDPAPWYVGLRRPAVLRGREDGRGHGGRGRGPRGQARGGRRRSSVDAHPGPVALGAPRRGQRLLHLGDRAQGDARPAAGRSRPRPRPRPLHVPARDRRLLRPPRDARRTRRDARRRARSRSTSSARLHGLGALRPQPHRPRPREEDVPARARRRGS